ncbi:two-component system, OmpR family, sensor kinase [Bradyrhizobium lablabi]|uniref:histidine kinase n=3 Tax=Nitrobacteraceae TaxID=41294 RepID=A0ABY0PR95_9BRAD|nr:two-component system, OmpR family, sensor kinase [Bradyrhizobium ottawaense]SED16264.1 two-component system, OmpR family, sensor kinase [Bradyrhizobium lablabi]SHL20960.1 two-component system, OmpR family, sensor kinase [Bradyrhizobium lablabi]
MTPSLRGRLFVGLTAMVAVTCAAAGFFAFRYAFDEAIEMQDATLTQIAALAIDGRFETKMTPAAPGNGVDAENRLVIEELGRRSDNAAAGGLLLTLDDGLRDVARGRERWRVLIRTRADGSRVMVGQPTSVREEIATASAFHTVVPLLLLVPLMLLVTAILVRQSLRPMTSIAETLDTRRADDLEELALDGVPQELRPFIASINRLLRRIQVMVERQRRFMADAAHELRTPITALTLQAENLDQVVLSQESAERLDALKQGARRTSRLLEQLLTLARHDFDPAVPAAVVELDRCARNVVADLLPESAEKGIDLGFDEIQPCRIDAEPLMIEILIRNILDNALRHTPRGGKIDISVQCGRDGATLTVEDTGPGIPPEDLDRIFEPFFRGTRHQGEGSGLGLSIVKRIVDNLGGVVTVQNVASAGATGLRATVRMPAVIS